MNEKTRENRARRQLAKEGYSLRKDRVRTNNVDHMGGYMIIDDQNAVVAGERFDFSLDDVDFFVRHKPPE